jgi:hypothetical protein
MKLSGILRKAHQSRYQVSRRFLLHNKIRLIFLMKSQEDLGKSTEMKYDFQLHNNRFLFQNRSKKVDYKFSTIRV